jgi:hypothetical protein
LSLKTKVNSLLVVWPQNHKDSFSRFLLKTGGDGFSRFDLKTDGGGFLSLGLKITMTVSWFGPQNQAGYGLSVAPSI